MPRPALLLVACLLIVVPAAAGAQATPAEPGRCAIPDSIAVRGNVRTSETVIRSQAALAAGTQLSTRAVRSAIETLFATGHFEHVELVCYIDPATQAATLAIEVLERPLLGDVSVAGVEAVSASAVDERVELLVGQPVDPAEVARTIQRIDSLYESEGYYLAEIAADTAMVEGRATITFRIDEGRRLAISGIRIVGNERLSDETIVGAMETAPEGFWWFRPGGFDDETFRADLAERLPAHYARRGFIDFTIVGDSLIVDRELGKGLIEITVDEGPQYRVGDFEIAGNRVFPTSELRRFYPFDGEGPTLTERVTRLVRRDDTPADVFDMAQWQEAVEALRNAYASEGYIWADIRPVIDRGTRPDGTPVVDLRWDIIERSPAIVNRVDIAGNDYTVESCIRDQIFVVPGDVYNQNALLRSYQSIANLGFFETPLPVPETNPINEEGDVDIIFNVTEKRTGNIQFGASVGQGTGLGGFIQLDQPNLFGMCKRGSLGWQFGRYIKDFNLSYTDPSIRQTRYSGTVNVYHSQSRFRIADLGQSTRIGGNLTIGFPVPWSLRTRIFTSYGAEAVKYDGDGLLGTVADECDAANCVRSTLGLTATHDSRVDLPFASGGGLQSFTAQFNGGPLGGSSDFQRYTGELRGYAPILEIGGDEPGSQPLKFVVGLTARAGAVFGSTGPFFYTQQFALGGTQFGEQLRGYEEFSITPDGFLTGTSSTQARRESFGNAFLSTTAELGLRLNSQIYLSAFMDAGNVWHQPRDINPTRLYRGAGVGASVITPFGPLGLDWAYGFDRLNEFGRPDPQWQFHFRLGQIF